MGYGTARTCRFTGMANRTTMIDQEMREVEPIFLRNEPHEILLDLNGISIGGPAQASRKTPDMGIYDEALNDAEGVA